MLLSDEEAATLGYLAYEHGCTTSDVVRMLIHKEVASWSAEQPAEWKDARWRDANWPRGWPETLRRRQVSERFYEAYAERKRPEKTTQPEPSGSPRPSGPGVKRRGG